MVSYRDTLSKVWRRQFFLYKDMSHALFVLFCCVFFVFKFSEITHRNFGFKIVVKMLQSVDNILRCYIQIKCDKCYSPVVRLGFRYENWNCFKLWGQKWKWTSYYLKMHGGSSASKPPWPDFNTVANRNTPAYCIWCIIIMRPTFMNK